MTRKKPRYAKALKSLLFDIDATSVSSTGQLYQDASFLWRMGEIRMAQSNIFICYSHKDKKVKENLLSHLSVLQSAGLIGGWDEARVEGCESWKHCKTEEI